ncbi:MAG TPA: helix-turn-helix transcriptional regulator [Kofleriaceae bacterium]
MEDLHRRVIVAIRDLAERQQIEMTHLPDRAGVARSHFWKVVYGTTSPTLRWLGKLAKALDVSTVELFQLSIARSSEPRATLRSTPAPAVARAAEQPGPRWRSPSRHRPRKRSK